jgi:hypothetical protein
MEKSFVAFSQRLYFFGFVRYNNSAIHSSILKFYIVMYLWKEY